MEAEKQVADREAAEINKEAILKRVNDFIKEFPQYEKQLLINGKDEVFIALSIEEFKELLAHKG